MIGRVKFANTNKNLLNILMHLGSQPFVNSYIPLKSNIHLRHLPWQMFHILWKKPFWLDWIQNFQQI